jgi:hypothetical protein
MSSPTRVLAGVTIPDTPIITKAIEFARQHLDDHGYNHVMRSWLTGQIVISRLPPPAQAMLDLEAYAVGTLLHDMGWSKTPEFLSKDKCFEVDGANVARDFLQREGDSKVWDKHRIQLVWDLIALHTVPWVAAHKQPEVALANVAIWTELVGIQLSKAQIGPVVSVTQDEMDTLAKEFPKAGFKGYVKETICGFCRTKPEVTYLTWQSGFGDRFVDGYSTEGKKVVDYMMENMYE